MTAVDTVEGAPTLDALDAGWIADRAEAAGEPAWLRERRSEAHRRWSEQEWPKVRGEEAWNDTPFTRFAVDLPVVTTDGQMSPAVPAGLVDGLEALAARADLRDGAVEVTVSDAAAEAGVVVADLVTAARDHEKLVREHLGGQTTPDHDRTVTTSDAAWTCGVLVYVPAEVELDQPIGLTVQVGRPGAHLPRVLVVADRHASAKVLLEHVSDVTEPATVDEVVEVVAGDGVHLDVVSLQDWDGPVGHICLHGLELHRDAEVRHLTVTVGGETVRFRPEVHLVGAGARIEPLGVYFSDEGQHFEHHPYIEHIAGHATSDVLYKGALRGKSRTVFRGHIYVGKDAVGTDTDEENKSLILTPGARADSTPFLEIECSEVTAGHGSATGQIDRSHLFYLESRGVRPEDALRMVVFGFFAEVLDRIQLPVVRDRAMAHIEAEIARADLTRIIEREQAAIEGGNPS